MYYTLLNPVCMTTVNYGVLTCLEYFEMLYCVLTCVFTVVCVRSLSSEDHIIAFVYTVGKYCV